MRLAATWDGPLEDVRIEARERAGVERLEAPRPREIARRMMAAVKEDVVGGVSC